MNFEEVEFEDLTVGAVGAAAPVEAGLGFLDCNRPTDMKVLKFC
jgi:hypothetical protein